MIDAKDLGSHVKNLEESEELTPEVCIMCPMKDIYVPINGNCYESEGRCEFAVNLEFGFRTGEVKRVYCGFKKE